MFVHVIELTFLWLTNMPLYGYTIFCSSINWLMDIWMFFHFLPIMKNAAMNAMYRFLYGHKFSVLLGIHLGVELLDRRVTLCVPF